MHNQVVAAFLARLEPGLAASFTPEQCAAIGLHFGMRYRAQHFINWRRRVCLPFVAFYFVVLAGKDDRRG
ncbi:MAG TPA: hypothetical protein PLT25_02055 [Acidocella sp.]|nr:hypothetical protein [Acidocella sp.]HQU03480.1 hypothetical protein [Acidocella sp.]